MARIKLIMPDGNRYRLSIPVRITDINYGNHLGNDSLVTLVHEARVQWLSNEGFSEMSVGGAGLIMNELMVNYMNESVYGDILDFEIVTGDIGSIGFEIFYDIHTTRNDKKVQIAVAKTGMVCFDYEKRKPSAIPENFLHFLKQNH
jgi:acyl-CoA thioesterase FadM